MNTVSVQNISLAAGASTDGLARPFAIDQYGRLQVVEAYPVYLQGDWFAFDGAAGPASVAHLNNGWSFYYTTDQATDVELELSPDGTNWFAYPKVTTSGAESSSILVNARAKYARLKVNVHVTKRIGYGVPV